MRKEELRIGNWISHINKNGTFTFQVEGIHGGVIVVYNGGVWTLAYDEIEPVRLTPEILDKCGFNDRLEFPNEPAFGLASNHSLKTYDLTVAVGEYNMGGDYRYLHQLQNLYYALTGTELEVKL